MVPFQVGPEELHEVIGQRFQAVVVQRGLALAQVVDEQVAYGTAGHLVAVDQLLQRALAGTPQLTQRRRGLVSEHTQVVQDPIEQVGRADRGAPQFGLDLQQFQDVAGGDVGDDAALGGEDLGGAVGDAGRGGRGDARILAASLPQPDEADAVPVLLHRPGQCPAAKRGGDQPRQ